jgi:lincosamide nucleotidyltransferase A/C/D/E
MAAEEALEIVRRLDAAGVAAWLDGGWAVDAALGEQTRAHDDLDLVVDMRHFARLALTLADMGYGRGSGEPPTSVEFVDASGRQVDVHPVAFTAEGDGLYRMETGEDWAYPAAGFDGEGRVLGRRIRCLTPDVQLLCHLGYTPHLSSYDDVWALCRRFGLTVPEEYRRPRESYEPR